MRVGVLSAAFSSASRITREMEGVSDCELYVILCPEDDRGLCRRVAKECWRLLRDGISWASLRLLMRGRVILLRKPLDDPASTSRLLTYEFDIGLHNAGVIYRERTFACFRLGILNPHIGILPAYRGRSVMEWSLLRGDPTGVTVFFMDTGIDSGERIVLRHYVDLHGRTSVLDAKNYLFSLDAQLFRRAIESLQTPDFKFERNNVGHRYYPMSVLLTEVVEVLLQKGLVGHRNEFIDRSSPQMA